MPSLVIQTPPSVEPVLLAEAKKHMNVSFTADDEYIQDLIRTARMRLEYKYERAFITQTHILSLDGFWQPSASHAQWMNSLGTWMGVWQSTGWNRYASWSAIELWPPVQSITSVQYQDPSGATQTYSTYSSDLNGEPARIYPALGKVWPVTAAMPNTVQITYVTGKNTPELVDPDAKHAIKMLVAHMYENREQVSIAIGHLASAIDVPRGVDDLMSRYWRPRVR